MNDPELDLALGDFGATRVQATAPPTLRQHVRTMPLPSKAERRWLPRSPKWRLQSMFSATEFVVAGAIVALFGGFVLAGVLTQPRQEQAPVSASPIATEVSILDWRSTVVTEDMAPGIVRVIGDGAGHDFEPAVGGLDPDEPGRARAARGFDEIAIDPAGDVWLHRPTGDLVRLGRPGSRPGPALWQDGGLEWLDVAPDGSVLAFDRTSGPNLRRLSETGASGASQSDARDALMPRWTWYDGFQEVESLVSVAPDASWEGPDIATLFEELQSAVKDPAFRAYPQEVWDQVSRNFGPVCDMAVTSDGSVWAGLCGDGGHGFGHGGLARVRDGAWQAVEPLAGTPDEDILVSDATLIEAGLDGTLWVLAYTNTPDGILIAINRVSGGRFELPERVKGRPLDGRPLVGQVLFHFDGEHWTAFPWRDVAGGDVATGRRAGLGVVDHEGRFWMGAGSETSLGWSNLLSFDGQTAGSHGSVGPIRDLALHPDGTVWAVGAEGLFVVDPAVAHDADAITGLETAEVDDATSTSTTAPDLLPGVDLVTEEVEPGVFRVLSDGIQDLTSLPHGQVRAGA